MRVLTITSSYPRFEGDFHGRFIHDLCCKLHESGLGIRVLAPRSKNSQLLPSDFPVERFPYLPFKRMETLSERTMKGAPLRNLLQLPPYMASAYLRVAAEYGSIV
ncbi:MAG: hypothetical protein JSV18_04800, partial [Candidatus Bathyarchaeota archaeon]